METTLPIYTYLPQKRYMQEYRGLASKETMVCVSGDMTHREKKGPIISVLPVMYARRRLASKLFFSHFLSETAGFWFSVAIVCQKSCSTVRHSWKVPYSYIKKCLKSLGLVLSTFL